MCTCSSRLSTIEHGEGYVHIAWLQLAHAPDWVHHQHIPVQGFEVGYAFPLLFLYTALKNLGSCTATLASGSGPFAACPMGGVGSIVNPTILLGPFATWPQGPLTIINHGGD